MAKKTVLSTRGAHRGEPTKVKLFVATLGYSRRPYVALFERERGYEMSVWYGVWVPAATPPEIVAKLNAEVNRIMLLPDVQQRLVVMGAEHAGLTPQQAHQLLWNDAERWGRIIREASIKADL